MSFTPTIAGKYLLAIRAVGRAEANGTQLANGTSPWVVRDIVLQVPPPALPHHHPPHTHAPRAPQPIASGSAHARVALL